MLSASAGMGGSLIIVPTLTIAYGPKIGIALAACLLAANNVFKIVAYREWIPWVASTTVIATTIIGAAIGAVLMIGAPTSVVQTAVALSVIVGFAFHRIIKKHGSKQAGAMFSLLAGITSGFSGTSGPLKGMALKSLSLDHMHLVAAASVVSFIGDLVKASIFSKANLIEKEHWLLVLILIPLMPIATFTGRKINRAAGQQYFDYLFWTVIAGYAIRLLIYAQQSSTA